MSESRSNVAMKLHTRHNCKGHVSILGRAASMTDRPREATLPAEDHVAVVANTQHVIDGGSLPCRITWYSGCPYAQIAQQ